MAEIPNGLSDGTAGQAEMVSPALSCLGSQTCWLCRQTAEGPVEGVRGIDLRCASTKRSKYLITTEV